MKTSFRLLNVIVTALTATAMDFAVAQVETPPLTIKRVRTGWSDDIFALESNGPIINPANCSITDAYVIGISSPGYKTHLAAALVAYSSGKQLAVVVSSSECAYYRPKIVGINLL